MDQRTLQTGDLQVGTTRVSGGILEATINGTDCLVKDAANRTQGSLRASIPNGTDLNREYATYLLAKIIGPGLVKLPAMAMRDHNGQSVLVMERINGRHEGSYGKLPTGINLTTKRNLALFDAVIGNTDRHSQNYFVLRDWANNSAEVVCIDHGLAFPIPNEHNMVDCGTSDFLRDEALPQWAVRWLNKFLSLETTIRATLATYLEPEAIDAMFDRIEWMIRKNRFLSKSTLRYGPR